MMIEQGYGDTMQDTVGAIAQLAMVTVLYHGTVAMLTAANAKLASQLEAAQSYTKMLKDEILAHKAKLRPVWQGQRPAKSRNNNN
jgi:hypothetical protein